MASSIAAASSHQPCILLSSNICIATCSRWNATTAVAETSNKLTIEVSLSLVHPPRISNLIVYCPGANFTIEPKIISTAKDVIFFGFPACSLRTASLENCCDYFIYRAGADPKRPSLTLIPNPKPNCFGDSDVGILPRGGDLFSIAALLVTGNDEYKLCRFDSEIGSWVTKAASLETPRIPFPPRFKTRRPHHHWTSTVISVGGKTGTMGWVDLWGGILSYDLLGENQDKPALRHLPLPLPMDILSLKDCKGVKLNCPDTRRGVFSLIKDGKACLKLADLQTTSKRLPYTDTETGLPVFVVDNWTITVWSMQYASGSYEDWRNDFTVHASDIIISNEVRLQLLNSGLLHRKPSQDNAADTVEVALRNIVVSEPNVSLNGDENVVFVIARTKFMHPKAFVLAIDISNRRLLSVAEFSSANMLGGFSYLPGTISKYMNLSTTTATRET